MQKVFLKGNQSCFIDLDTGIIETTDGPIRLEPQIENILIYMLKNVGSFCSYKELGKILQNTINFFPDRKYVTDKMKKLYKELRSEKMGLIFSSKLEDRNKADIVICNKSGETGGYILYLQQSSINMTQVEQADIIENRDSIFEENNNFSKELLSEYLDNIDKKCAEYINSIIFCENKWGACIFDEEIQNTNTCEGILSLLLSHYENMYFDIIKKAIEDLNENLSERGLKSKSLDLETVVPTAMYIYISKIQAIVNIRENAEKMERYLWESRCDTGWGIYVKNMSRYTNIGCSYWAIQGLKNSDYIPKEDFFNFVSNMYRYENTYTYGRTIHNSNPRIPCLYSSAMMYITYMELPNEQKNKIGKKYNKSRAINFIVKNFDNPFYLVEQEGIDGVELGGKQSVHTVNWNHMTIHYSLKAIAIAIDENELDEKTVYDVLKRIKLVIEDNSENNGGRLFWSAPSMNINKGARGNMIFPTMHFLMGISAIKEQILKIVSNKNIIESEKNNGIK